MPAVPGLTPGQFIPAGSLYAQGLSAGTPRNWAHGGQQMYDPRYVRPLTQESTMPTTRPLPGAKPSSGGGVVGGGNWRFGATPTSFAGQPQMGQMQGGSSVFSQNPVFSPQTTARSEYAIRAGADRASNLPFVMKQFDRPGVSRGAGTVASAAAQIAATQSQGREGAANQFLDDYLANQRYLLDAEMARERERLGLGNVQARIQEMIQRQQLGATGGLLSMLDF